MNLLCSVNRIMMMFYNEGSNIIQHSDISTYVIPLLACLLIFVCILATSCLAEYFSKQVRHLLDRVIWRLGILCFISDKRKLFLVPCISGYCSNLSPDY